VLVFNDPPPRCVRTPSWGGSRGRRHDGAVRGGGTRGAGHERAERRQDTVAGRLNRLLTKAMRYPSPKPFRGDLRFVDVSALMSFQLQHLARLARVYSNF